MTLQEFLLNEYDAGLLYKILRVRISGIDYQIGSLILAPGSKPRKFYERLNDNFYLKQLKKSHVESYEREGTVLTIYTRFIQEPSEDSVESD